ncbi:MAG: B12-binding domain-containing radical SAM protein [Myxococcota bacterium]
MTKLLLTSVIRPFGGPGEGDSVGAELFHAQVTRAQGPFSLRQVIRCWAIDYIAENVSTPAVTLHYPSRKELIAELAQGDYTHVGINFVVATFHKVREMVSLIRRHAPGAKIVLGGYGTVLPDELLQPYADAICREEGAGFMRRLLGEDMDRPIRHPHAPIPSVSVLGWQLPSVVGHVTAGLGCPNGCDFCCTSHFFDRRYERFSSRGRDIYEALLATRARARADGQNMSGFILIDEDFFLHHKRAREFLECVREGGEAIQVMGFGSIRGLSKFTPREIAEMGFTLVWNAFEGKEAGYHKQRGKPIDVLYRDLKSVGCAQLTSMIIGFPYQDEATIRAELDELTELDPALVQCLIYFAFPGTPFHRQVIAEDRYRPEYQKRPDLRRWDGFAMHFGHPKFDDPGRVEELQQEIYREDFRRLGPTPLRLARVWLEGYENLRNDPNPLLAQRAEQFRQDVRGVLPAIAATLAFAPSPQARERARALRRDIIRLTGEPTAAERAMSAAAPALYAATRATRRLGLLQQPGLLRTEHRTGGDGARLHGANVHRLQGGFQSGVGRALLEDLGELTRRLRVRRGSTPDAGAPTEAHAMVTRRAESMPRSLPVVQPPPA